MKRKILRVLKRTYTKLPISLKYKNTAKTIFYKLFGWALKDTEMYRAWKYTHSGESEYFAGHLEGNMQENAYTQYALEGFKKSRQRSTDYIEDEPTCYIEPSEGQIKLIAFYLPQFHPIKENDLWWGRGFTEWTNVTKAVPQFIGHHQPQLPVDLGFYDLRNVETMERQVELAIKYGVYGFCFHHYWFAGKRLLETPVNNYLKCKNIDFPFCLCWANENWTRRWDGHENEVLIKQEHSPEDDIAFIKDIFSYFDDARYIKIQDKPVLIVYRLKLFPDPAKTIKRWRIFCEENGHPGLYIIGVKTFGEEIPPSYGVDATMEFPPHGLNPLITMDKIDILNPDFSGVVYDYKEIVNQKRYLSKDKLLTFKTVSPGWDNTARKPNNPTIFYGSSPSLYKEWLTDIISHTKINYPKDMQMVFVNAWNEWAEGAHLEPDRRYGYAYLKATAEAVMEAESVCDSNNVMNLTPRHNVEIYNARWEKLHTLFNGRINKYKYAFLVHYTKVLCNVEKFATSSKLCICDGAPCIETGNELLKIENHESINIISERLIKDRFDNVITFVLLQFNKPDVTIECINSIKALADDRVRIVVVDNGSSQECKDYIKQQYSKDTKVKVIFNNENLGFAKGNNVGYKYAKKVLNSKYIVMINNDTLIQDTDFINKMEQLFQEWSYSILGPDIEILDGRHENPWNDYIYGLEELRDITNLYKKQRQKFVDTSVAEFKRIGMRSSDKEIIINPILQGAAFVISPIYIIDNDDFFDERTFIYGEEFLLSANALIKGELLLYSSKLKIIHAEAVSTAQLDNCKKIMMGYDNVIEALSLASEMLSLEKKIINHELIYIERKDVKDYLRNENRNILLDLFFCQPGFHGGGEYGKAVFKGLVESYSDLQGVDIWAALNPDIFIDRWIWDICKERNIKIIPVNSFEDIIDVVNMDCFDMFFAPALVVYTGYEYMGDVGEGLKFKNQYTKIVGTVHDIRDYELAENYRNVLEHKKNVGCIAEVKMEDKKAEKLINEKKKYAESLQKMYRSIFESNAVDLIITDSEYSERSILSNVGDYQHKLKVLYAPMKDRVLPCKFDSNHVEFEEIKYALIVSAGRLEKNAFAVAKCFDDLFSQGVLADFYVVLCGISSIEELDIRIENKSRFIVMGYLEPKNLEYLYMKATFLAYASLSEGFGYPPVEAMSYGVPSLVSNLSSIPEICAEAAVYCDPYNMESIKNAIIQIVTESIDSHVLFERLQLIQQQQKKDLDCLLALITGSEASVESVH